MKKRQPRLLTIAILITVVAILPSLWLAVVSAQRNATANATLRFDSSTYSVSESAGSLATNVTGSGNNPNPATVGYLTGDGAVPRRFSDDGFAPTQAGDSRSGMVRLRGEVPSALAGATRLSQPMPANTPLTLTLVLNRTDQQGFEAFLRDVQDPQSPSFRHYLTQRQLADRFGPSPTAYKSVLDWLRRKKFTSVHGSDNRLTITVRGTQAQTEKAFGLRLDNYRLEDRTFYANDRDPALPAAVASHVQAVIGLSNLARPVRARGTEIAEMAKEAAEHGEKIGPDNLPYSCWVAGLVDTADTGSLAMDMTIEASKGGFNFALSGLSPAITLLRFMCAADELNMLNRLAVGLPPAPGSPSAANADMRMASLAQEGSKRSSPGASPNRAGDGQKIGLLEFDNFRPSDVKNFLSLIGRPSQFSQLSQVHVGVGAGAPGPDQSEVLLDIDAVMSLAPGAQVIVYDGPFNGRGSFQTMLNAMINGGVNVISNSWAYCEDQTTLADVQSIDSILAGAAASGITVVTGSGDHGSTCLNGSANTVHVPASSPHITAVGGSSPRRNVGGTYGSETWWGSLTEPVPTGQGGFGVSRFFSRPSYQDGLTSAAMRSVPDVTAPADPAAGYFICQESAGGCPTNLVYGGTSVAAPIWAAFVAVLNQQENRKLGFLNPLIYPLARTTAFHSAAEMGSDFSHVGLGSPNVGVLHLALTGGTVGAVSPDKSSVGAFPPVVVADGKTQAGVAVMLVDGNGNSVSGQSVQLTMNSGSQAVVTALNSVTNVSNGAALFTVADMVPETVTFTATVGGVTLSQHPTVRFVSPPAAAGSISASPATVTANGSDTTTITVTLQDAKGNPSPGKVISLSQGNGSSIVSGTTGTTDATGRVQFTATDAVAEAVTYTAVDTTDGNLPIPGSATVNFVNAVSNPCHVGLGTAASGYAVTTFASGFISAGCSGPAGLAFDNQGNNLFVMNFATGLLYKFGTAGGTANSATQVSTTPIPPSTRPLGMTFSKDGQHLYLAQQSAGGAIVELSTTTGQIVRTLGAPVATPTGLATDPLSGDLFFTEGAFFGDHHIWRINNPEGPSPAFTVYAGFPNGGGDGLAFGPDGTLYAEFDGQVWKVAGTNAPNPGAITRLADVRPLGPPDGIAVGVNPSNPGAAPFLVVNNNNGTISRIDLTTNPPTLTNIYTNGSRGDFATVGPNGCLYATQTDRVIKVTNADGSCGLAPANPSPQIVLTPETASPSPAQGTSVTFTATLKNVPNPANIPITLLVAGANPGPHLVTTDANGNASFTYTGVRDGADLGVAFANINGSLARSNTGAVTWTPGKHSTFLSLNMSPAGGSPNKPLMLTATLADISASPIATVGGVPVSFTLAGQTCAATTDGSGAASCSLTPNAAAGSYQITATFGGTGLLLSSSATKTVELIGAAQPTVQFSAANYNTPAGCAAAQITVTRTGDSSGAVTVDYATGDGMATQRSDYTISSGTLTFAAGETSKSFPILITEDNYVKGNEQLTLTLSNPAGGASLGSPIVATVTIIDGNTAAPTTNPNDDAGVFVCHHYHDFLAREADSGGAAYWTNQINLCGTDQACVIGRRVGVSAAYFTSLEFQQSGYYVYRLYKAGLGRQPTYAEFMPDRSRVVGGADLEASRSAFANLFITRPAFTAQNPSGMTPGQYVDALNANTGMALTQSERDALVGGLTNQAETRASVLRKVADNQAFQQKEYNSAFVLMQYFGYLRRDPDAGGYQFWLKVMNGLDPKAFQGMTCAFITSREYQERFSPVVNYSNQDCGRAR